VDKKKNTSYMEFVDSKIKIKYVQVCAKTNKAHSLTVGMFVTAY